MKRFTIIVNVNNPNSYLRKIKPREDVSIILSSYEMRGFEKTLDALPKSDGSWMVVIHEGSERQHNMIFNQSDANVVINFAQIRSGLNHAFSITPGTPDFDNYEDIEFDIIDLLLKQ